MKLRFFLPLVLLLIAAQDVPAVAIASPSPGDVLRGTVTIIGRADDPNFQSAQLDFGYALNITPGGGPADTWFTLQTFSQPVLDSALTTWDTLSITDGDYILRLRMTLADGSFQDVTVAVSVQNDAPLATSTPQPTSTPVPEIEVQVPTPFLLAASPTPTEPPRPTPTVMPTNPVSLNQRSIYTSLGRGALVILGLFFFAGVILRLRRN